MKIKAGIVGGAGYTAGELLRILLHHEFVELGGIVSSSNAGNPIHQVHDDLVGDTILGIKGRVGFEASAPLILIKGHHLLEKHTSSRWQLLHKDYIANWYGTLLHEAQYLDPVMRDMEAFLESSQARVSGTVYVTLKPYQFELLGVESPFDMMQSKVATYGEENNAWDSRDAKGFIKIFSNQLRIHSSFNDEN